MTEEICYSFDYNVDLLCTHFYIQVHIFTKQWKLHSSDLRHIKKLDSVSNLHVVPFGPAKFSPALTNYYVPQ